MECKIQVGCRLLQRIIRLLTFERPIFDRSNLQANEGNRWQVLPRQLQKY